VRRDIIPIGSKPDATQMRKILLITDTWQETNGLTTTLHHTLAAGRQRGYEFVVLHPALFPCFRNPFYRQYWHALPSPWRVQELLCAARPDAVHIATEGPLGWAGRLVCVQHGWRFTTSFHTRWDEHGKYLMAVPPALVWRWMHWFHARSACVLAPTPSIVQLLRRHGFVQSIELWQRGIDIELFHPRPKTHHAVRRPVLLYVGRISREKNLPDFLDLPSDGTKYVVGDGPLLTSLRRTYQHQVEAGRLIFFGERKGTALAELYAEADVFVFPSVTETFGNVILEALASGVPVAAYPVSGPGDILTGMGVGALHPDLAMAVQLALTHGQAEACLALASHYSWEAATTQFLRALVPVSSSPHNNSGTTYRRGGRWAVTPGRLCPA
jgi:glycosyltransferase involved in cell wall biosynthesis